MEDGRGAVARPARHRPAPNLPAQGSRSAGFYQDPPIVDELCRIETFKDNFNTRDFLSALSERQIALSRADPGPFNPKPFTRTFEAAVQSLQTLRKDLQREQSTLGSSVQVAQSAYSSKLHELASHFTSVSQSFSSLESRFSEVSRTAIHIGEQLETIDRQRSRAVEAHDLIEHYYAFAREDTSKLDRLRKEGGRQGRLKTAIIARRLGAISREVDVPGADKTREIVDKYNEGFEKDMLKLFDKFYRRSDPRMMSHIAQVLQNFNGGQSCVQIYVNQHDFFISKDRIGEAGRMESSQIWQTLPDPDALPPNSEPFLSSLFDEIRTTVEQEAQIISAVFPNPLMVMSTFLQRVFAQSVQGYIEVLMSKAAEVGAVGRPASSSAVVATMESGPTLSDLAFLRVLHMARSMALALISDLKVYDFRGAAGGASRDDEQTQSLTLGIFEDHSSHATGSLQFQLEAAVEEIFAPYMEGHKYLERESKSIAELYAAYLSRFTAHHKQPSKGKTGNTTTGLFDRVRAAAGGTAMSSTASSMGSSSAQSSTSTLVAPPSTTAAPAVPAKTSAFSKFTGFVDRARGTTPQAIPSPVLDAESSADASMVPHASLADQTPIAGVSDQAEEGEGDLSLTVAERMLRWHAEAIGRCVDLSPPSDVGKNVFTLLRVLAEGFIKSYIELAIDSATTAANAQDVKSATLPDLSALRLVRQVELITILWQHYFSVALLPLAGSSVTLRREMAIFNNHNLLRVEGKCDALVQKLLDNVIAFLTARLATQKKNDFAPKNDELAFARMNTDPCVACSEALERVARSVQSSLGGKGSKNAEAILTEIGIAFHSLLLDHFKKYTVSAAGGLMLTKDLAMYQDAIATFGSPALNDRFEMLRSLGNLFIVQPSVLKGYMREGHLSKIDERLLHAFLLRRSDYAKEVRDLDEGTPTSSSLASQMDRTASGGGASRDGGKNGTGTLSMMLSDLERFAAGQEVRKSMESPIP